MRRRLGLFAHLPVGRHGLPHEGLGVDHAAHLGRRALGELTDRGALEPPRDVEAARAVLDAGGDDKEALAIAKGRIRASERA